MLEIREMVKISVADTGVGIAAEDPEAIFEEFRAGPVTQVHRVAWRTNLGAQSQPGKGSTFSFTLPT